MPLEGQAQPVAQSDRETRTETFTIPVLGTPMYRAKLYTQGVTELCARLAREGWGYDEGNKPYAGATTRVTFVRKMRPVNLPDNVGAIEVVHFGAGDFNPVRQLKAFFGRGQLEAEVKRWREEAKQKGWIIWYRYRYTYNGFPAVFIGYERPEDLPPPNMGSAG